VVGQHQQDVVGLTEHEQPAADGEFGGKVEDMACRVVEILGQPLRIALPHKEDGPGLLGVAYLLVGLAVDLKEAGAQHLVSLDDVGESPDQRIAVEAAGQPEGQWHVVGRAVFSEPGQEPQSTLGVGKRDHWFPHPVTV